MNTATGQGQTTPGHKIFMSTETSCHFSHLLQVKKKLFAVWFYTIFFMILYKYIAPGQGLTTPWACNFDVNRNILSLRSFVASFKRSLWSLILYIFFLWFIHAQYIVTRLGQTAPMGQSFDVNRNVLLLHSFVASFKKLSLKSDFIQTFLWLNTCIQPRGTADRPQGIKFWWQQKGFIILPNCSKFQTNLFEVWFHTIFFHDLILYIAPGQGQTATRGQNFDVSRN